MATLWDKIDHGLATIYADFLRVREGGPRDPATMSQPGMDGGKLHVQLQFAGSLVAVENAGFQTVWSDGKGRASQLGAL